MSNVTISVRFRPLNSSERRGYDDAICFQALDAKSFWFTDEKEDDVLFCFDKVFYPDCGQADVYEFLAMPIIGDAMNGINGTIITYGQTGAGKTYSMEGPNIFDCDEHDKGLLQRVVDGLLESLKSSTDMAKCTLKLSMVEIYMDKIRDLFDLSKDNLQIKQGKNQEMYISGATEISISNALEAMRSLSGIANRAVGETQMNLASSRSHCLYIFLVQRESVTDGRMRTGKIVLVDLAGSEKVEKTGAGGRILDEAKKINKSLSSLGNVINALTTGKTSHIPYRDSKLTRILRDALGGNSRTALLCCCSPSPSNASESLSTLRFGTRAKLIKTPLIAIASEQKDNIEKTTPNNSHDRVLENLRMHLSEEDVDLLEELFMMKGISFDPQSPEDIESAYDDVTFQIISSVQQAVEDLRDMAEQLTRENSALKAENNALKAERASHQMDLNHFNVEEMPSFFGIITIGIVMGIIVFSCPLFLLLVLRR
ncbi:kinesin-like protein KIN-1 isoform X2 [Phoenix dactylifera]|uniref:Kinesin-like protein n=1 Tax=Phoenix dactylifera TaxID=42345 RepID=A0A8B8ZM47_PHODC|nr:kinesin-like protein KIN-1 isoform X2 [Phoenix dactylifera]